ncbi:tetratricopeptide repeat protein [Neosynechococcus sphagnicola]|uniref:tetratricopeptide repeat protein n=1 Tax=Neosynechococcus sphagnicola TaxID=1501145 RepID=UPI000691D87A|nr:tetratricopeptide repeat protein [Neosynechococcus sphagnicola]
MYRLSGNIHGAIACHQKSSKLAHQLLQEASPQNHNCLKRLNLKNWQQHDLFNIGICQLELWELDAALAVFTALATDGKQQLIQAGLADLYNPSVDVFTAFVASCLGNTPQAETHAAQFMTQMQQQPILGTGHRFLFLGLTYKNLGQQAIADELLQRAIAYADENYYPQVRGNALSGLAELYRRQGNFATAFTYHTAALEILEPIGTHCDLAEAHFQLGLTYQAQGDGVASQPCFERALQLFATMAAPKQVRKVQQALVATSKPS